MTLADQNRALKAALKAARPYVWAAAHDPANSVAIARLAVIDAALAAYRAALAVEPASGEAAGITHSVTHPARCICASCQNARVELGARDLLDL